MVRLGGLAGASLAGRATGGAQSAPAAPREAVDRPLKITAIETFIARVPPDRDKGPEAFISMPPIGATTGGVGLWNRLERSETVRQSGHSQTLYVKVSTDQGIVGWGEGHAVVAPRAAQYLVRDLFAPILIGQDARDVEPIWEKMYSTEKLRGYGSGVYTRAMAGIDIALWDILGKAMGVPLYRLLGGRFRDRVATYAGLGGSSIESVRENALWEGRRRDL
jgi:L-alanine-DL-glutamate epimerase-like enolase superfamily enzyme